jgi:hypothetical protein
MNILPTGATTFNYGVSCPSLTVGGKSVTAELGARASLSGAAFSGAVTVPSALDVIPAVTAGRSEVTFYKYINKSGIAEDGAQWTLGRDAHGVGANSFSIGANVLGAALSISSDGVVTIPETLTVTGTITSGGLPVSSKPYIAGRITGSTTIVNGAVPIVSGSTAANNAGQQLIATAVRQSVGRYAVTWATPHPNGANYGVYVTARMANGWANWGFPQSTSFEMYCYTVTSGSVTFADPTDIAFQTIP